MFPHPPQNASRRMVIYCKIPRGSRRAVGGIGTYHLPQTPPPLLLLLPPFLPANALQKRDFWRYNTTIIEKSNPTKSGSKRGIVLACLCCWVLRCSGARVLRGAGRLALVAWCSVLAWSLLDSAFEGLELDRRPPTAAAPAPRLQANHQAQQKAHRHQKTTRRHRP